MKGLITTDWIFPLPCFGLAASSPPNQFFARPLHSRLRQVLSGFTSNLDHVSADGDVLRIKPLAESLLLSSGSRRFNSLLERLSIQLGHAKRTNPLVLP